MRFLIVLFYLLSTLPVHATLNDVDKTQIYNKNLLKNGGFENGKQYWTPNDTADLTTSTSSPLEGLVMGLWDADASTDTLITTAVTIPTGMYGRNSVASCVFVTASGTATHTIQAYAGSNILSSQTITSSTTPTRSSANFIMPSSSSIQLRIYANADEPEIKIDSCFLGPAEGYNVGNVSQATFVGSAYFAETASCMFVRTSTSLGALSDADCPGVTVVSNPGPGTIQTTDYNAPKVAVNNLPPGTYRVVFSFSPYVATSAQESSVAIYDGTATYGQVAGNNDTGAGTITLEAVITYTSAGDRTFEIYASSAANEVRISNGGNNQRVTFNLYRFPTTDQIAVTTDKVANTWQGYHGNNCTFTLTGITTPTLPGGDATCTFTQVVNRNMGTVSSVADGTGNQPAITFTPSTAGEYLVCASAILYPSTTATIQHQLYTSGQIIYDVLNVGSTNGRVNMNACGVLSLSSTAAVQIESRGSLNTGNLTWNANINSAPTMTWSITKLSQLVNAPVLVNSVVSSSSGVLTMNMAAISAAGVVSSETGDWISGNCALATNTFTCTLNAGIFSTAPVCFIQGADSGATNGVIGTLISTSTSTVVFETTRHDATTTAYASHIQCTGAK